MILGFVSDSHGCVEALDKALDVLRRSGADRVYHLGDSIGYFPGWAAADSLRELEVPSLRGNHEAMLLSPGPKPELDDVCAIGQARDEATSDQMDWAASLPVTLRFEEHGRQVIMMHGSPRDPVWEYVQPDAPLDGYAVEEARAVVMGHTHRSCLRWCKGVCFMNAGSCALPRDEEQLGSVCVWDTKEQTGRILKFTVGREARLAATRTPVHSQIQQRIETLPL